MGWRRLLARYGSAAEALDALPGLARAGGRPRRLPSRRATTPCTNCSTLARLGGHNIFAGAPDYPPLLAMLDDAPAVLSVLGNPAYLADRAVALVGGRNASANGQRMAENLAAELARTVVVVSGLARGIDARRPCRRLTDRPHHSGGGRRPRRPLPAGARRSATAHCRIRGRGRGGAARHRTAGAPLPAAEPNYRRSRAGGRRGGGGAALRQSDHREPRARRRDANCSPSPAHRSIPDRAAATT